MKKIINTHKFLRIMQDPRSRILIKTSYKLEDSNILIFTKGFTELGDFIYFYDENSYYRQSKHALKGAKPLTECILDDYPITQIKLEIKEQLFDGLKAIRKRFKV